MSFTLPVGTIKSHCKIVFSRWQKIKQLTALYHSCLISSAPKERIIGPKSKDVREGTYWASPGIVLTPTAGAVLPVVKGSHLRKHELSWEPCEWCWVQFSEKGYSITRNKGICQTDKVAGFHVLGCYFPLPISTE